MDRDFILILITVSLALNTVCLIGLKLQWNIMCDQGENIKELTKQVKNFLTVFEKEKNK